MVDSDREQRVLKQVQKLIADQLSVPEEEITMETNFADDLEADSLDLVGLIMALEVEFGGEIPDEEAEKLTTMRATVDWILEHLKED